jgi:hypothetical protein
MTKKSRLIRMLVEQWIERFGEPPPIITDPILMQSILDAVGPREPAPEDVAEAA